jgi:hypothetical protein
VKLVDRLDPQALKPFGHALLPLALTKAANYPWLDGTVCVLPSVGGSVATLEGKVVDRQGKLRKTTSGPPRTLEGSGFLLWTGSWELFDLPPGVYALEITALDKDGRPVTAQAEKFLQGDLAASGQGAKP